MTSKVKPSKSKDITHLIFDVESVADGELIAKTRYPDQGLSPTEAIATYQDELTELNGTTFIPHTYQVPTAVVIAKITSNGTLDDIVSLDEPQFRPHIITQHFWLGWEKYNFPTWVTFNGRSFDLPLMELSAFRYGLSLGRWFQGDGYKAARNRFNKDSHLDLQEILTNYGAARCNGGLNLIANLVAKPGKVGLRGDQVQGQFDKGNHQQISDYCRSDVLDTYFVFLRTQTLMGVWDIEHELNLVKEAKVWVEKRADDCQAYRDYLDSWSDWENPWAKVKG
jgi:3'-5' exonuclease